MDEIKLSILIPTVVGREKVFNRLINLIVGQAAVYYGAQLGDVSIEDDIGISCASDTSGEVFNLKVLRRTISCVEVLSIEDDKQISIGKKRDLLYAVAFGKYSWQIDDDDSIHPEAIKMILEAIDKEAPDCITFREKCIIDGRYYASNHALKYQKWAENSDGYDYVRSPFYKDVIKTEIAQKVPFPDIRWNEDEQFSYALLPHLKTEVHIDEELYIYQHETGEDFNTRYGIK